jgi:hypothetical protein
MNTQGRSELGPPCFNQRFALLFSSIARRKNQQPVQFPDSPAVRGANKERAALPVTSDEKGAPSVARRRKR